MQKANVPQAPLVPVLACLLLSVAAGCGGGGHGALSQLSGESQLAAPAATAAPAAGFSGLPSPQEALRQVSYTSADRVRVGSGYLVSLLNNVTADGDSADYAPTWQAPDQLSTDDLAYAIYGFNLAGYTDESELGLGWQDTAPDVGDVFVGLGAQATGTWHWYSQEADGRVALTDIGPYISGSGGLVVAVVLTGTGNFSLDWVRIGANIAPLAVFEADHTSGDAPLNVQFDCTASTDLDGSIAIVKCDLDGDDFFEETGNEPGIYSHEYDTAGTYDAALQLIDDDGAVTNKVVTIVVNDPGNQPPVADLTADPTGGEPPLVVDFDASGSYDPDGSITLVEWDFDGNGTFETDTGTNLTTQHTYSEMGEYDAAVRVFDDHNVSATDSVHITVSSEIPNEPPTAALSADPAKGPHGMTCFFDASASTDTDGTIELYEWDWSGDGTYDDSGTSPTTSHAYTSGGLYEAKVRVTDDDGATDTATFEVKVYHETENNDTYDTGNTFPGIDFSGWQANCGVGGYDGDFDDWYKIVITQPGWVTFYMFHHHADSDLDMRLYDTDGTTELEHSTSVSDNEVFDHEFTETGTYYWHIYVFNADPEVADYMLETKPGIAPDAALTATPDEGDAPLAVTLDASASTDDGTIVQYEWDYEGDGTYDQTTGEGQSSVNHTYNDGGFYHPVVRVTDNDGLTDTATDDVTASGGPPAASFTATPTSGARVLEVQLDASASTGTIVKYEWDFDGNGVYDLSKTTGSDMDQATAYYYSTGTFDVTLRVTDNLDRTDTTSRSVSVSGDADNESEPNNDTDENNTDGDAALADSFPAIPFENWYAHVGPIPVESGPFNDPDDWYKFTLTMASDVDIYMQLFDPVCDIDMKLYAQGDYETAVGSSTGVDDDEEITETLDPGTYYLRVYAWNNSSNDGKEGGYRIQVSSGPPTP